MSVFVSVTTLADRAPQVLSRVLYETGARVRAEQCRKKQTKQGNHRPRCYCGFKIRGENHEAGAHHKQGSANVKTRGQSTGK